MFVRFYYRIKDAWFILLLTEIKVIKKKTSIINFLKCNETMYNTIKMIKLS